MIIGFPPVVIMGHMSDTAFNACKAIPWTWTYMHARFLVFGVSFHLLYFVCVSSEGSGETVQLWPEPSLLVNDIQ